MKKYLLLLITLCASLAACSSGTYVHRWLGKSPMNGTNDNLPVKKVIVMNTRDLHNDDKILGQTRDDDQVRKAASVEHFKNYQWLRVLGEHKYTATKNNTIEHSKQITWVKREDLKDQMLANPPHIVVFVHGFNTNVKGSLERSAELAESLNEPGNAGDGSFPWEVAAFQWPAEAKDNPKTAWNGLLNLSGITGPLMAHYGHDNLQVDNAAYNLAMFISQIYQFAKASKIHPKVDIVAHSMGSQVVLKALAFNTAYTSKSEAQNGKISLSDASIEVGSPKESDFNYAPFKIGTAVFVAPDVTVRKLKALAPLAIQSSDKLAFFTNTKDYILDTSKGINHESVIGEDDKKIVEEACSKLIKNKQNIKGRILVEDVTKPLAKDLPGRLNFVDRHYPLNSKMVRDKVVSMLREPK